MRSSLCIVGVLFFGLGLLSQAGAQEKHAPKKGPQYKFKIHDEATHSHKEQTFDLSRSGDADDLLHKLNAGLVEEGEQIKEMPNPLHWEWDLAIWSIVVFVLLLLILRKLAWGPMLEGLQKRESSIRSAIDEAKLAREETERLRTQFKTEMDQAFARIPQMLEEARRDGEKLVEEMRSKAQSDITTDRQRLRREIDTARDQALQELWNQAAQLATLISAKAIGRSLSVDDHRRLLDEALVELRQAKTA